MQIVTSIQDTAFSTIPRLVAFLVGLHAVLPWMLYEAHGVHDRASSATWAAMPASLTLSTLRTLYGFLLVLARVAGAFVFVPLPGVKDAPQAARVVLALAFTFALYPQWPASVTAGSPAGRMRRLRARWRRRPSDRDRSAVAFLAEALHARRAGHRHAGRLRLRLDHRSQHAGRFGVLLVFAQLIAGMLFFALGLDREILRLFAAQPGDLSRRALSAFSPRSPTP